jgi:hypothetical protein
LLLAPAAIGLLVLQAVADRLGHSMALLTREPATALQGPFYAGYVSNIGVGFWCFAGACCLFSALLLRREPEREWPAFLLLSGLFTSWLMLDDFFLFHDELLSAALRLQENTVENYVFAAYLAIGLAYMVRFHRTMLQTPYVLLLLAIPFFMLSLAVDVGIIRPPEERHHLVEDGTKLLGIICWCVYLVVTAYEAVRAAMDARLGHRLDSA